MLKKGKVIIVFPDNWLSYSPTVVNITELLSRKKYVLVLTTGKENFLSNVFRNTDSIGIEFVDIESKRTKKLVRRIDLMFISFVSLLFKVKRLDKGKYRELLVGYNLENFIHLRKFRKRVREVFEFGDSLIGVDNVGVLSVSKMHVPFHALSLEVSKNIFYYCIRWKKVKSLVIQTKERQNYLLPKKYAYIQTYFVQNAPVVDEFVGMENVNNRHSLIYLGNLAVKYNALNKVADSLYHLPDAYCFVLKGYYNENAEKYFKANYTDLYSCGRIKFDYDYVSNSDMPLFLKNFSFGITLYDISVLPYSNFNVISCPSGKLFNYYNSGIPVIGNDIIGLRSVEDFDAGILIKELSGEAIATAILKISQKYEYFQKNAFEAARRFDFKKNVNVFFRRELSVDVDI